MTTAHHLNNVPWHEAPLPPEQHDCSIQTTGGTANLPVVDRCACGAIRLGPGRPWMEVNSRRKGD